MGGKAAPLGWQYNWGVLTLKAADYNCSIQRAANISLQIYLLALPAITTPPQHPHPYKAATPNPAAHETPSALHKRIIMVTVLLPATGEQLKTHLITTTGSCEGNHLLVWFYLILEFLFFPISISQCAVGKIPAVSPLKNRISSRPEKVVQWDILQNIKLSAELCTDRQAMFWSHYKKTARYCSFCIVKHCMKR